MEPLRTVVGGYAARADQRDDGLHLADGRLVADPHGARAVPGLLGIPQTQKAPGSRAPGRRSVFGAHWHHSGRGGAVASFLHQWWRPHALVEAKS